MHDYPPHADRQSAGEAQVSRRKLVKKGALLSGVVGAAWTAPMVYDSMASPAAAATSQFVDFVAAAPSAGQPSGYHEVPVPKDIKLYYELIGGGGGGGAYQTYNGGSGMRIRGEIPAQTSNYTLRVFIAAGGSAATTLLGTSIAGGTGFSAGGAGNAVPIPPGTRSGLHGKAGGGGGGASAIVTPDGTTIKIVAAGGGGGSGGGENNVGAAGRSQVAGDRFASANVANAPLAGTAGEDGKESGNTYRGFGGKGGGTTGGGLGGSSYGGTWATHGSPGTTTTGGSGGTGSDNDCGTGGGGGGGLFGGGGGGGATYSGSNDRSGGAGGSGSSTANGPAGITGTVQVQDRTDPGNAAVGDPHGSGPGHVGLGGHSYQAPRDIGKAGGDGAVKLSAAPFSDMWPVENATP